MKLRTAAVDITDDEGHRLDGPYSLDYSTGKAALPKEARKAIKELEPEFGRLKLRKE